MTVPRHTVLEALRRFDKIVVWGLRRSVHSHRYIHQHFYSTLIKLGVSAAWVDDSSENNDLVGPNDLVITADMASSALNMKRPAFYVLHNITGAEDVPPERRVSLQVYTREADQRRTERWNPTTLFDASSRTLYQAWGTNLLAEEFHQPVHGSVRSSSILFWVGSVWNNASNQGNLEQIADLKRVISDRGKKFVKVRFIPNWMNSALMRRSFLAPAIAGGWQVDHDYLPCRMFKNISYGQLGLSNVTGFKLILGDATVEANSIAELIDRALSISDGDFHNLIREQQRSILDHTYDQKLYAIARAMSS